MDNMMHSDHSTPEQHPTGCSMHHGVKKGRDWFLPLVALIIILAYVAHLFLGEFASGSEFLITFNLSVFELMNRMWWGVALGILSVGFIGTLPRELVSSALGKGGTLGGILRATGAGVMLDLCSHGILLVGMKLYERGASLGQTMAFLIASPWNSFSLTLILWSLIGFKWMILILIFSLLIALASGIFFDRLVKKGILPANPHKTKLPESYCFKKELITHLKKMRPTPVNIYKVSFQGLKDSRMILKWIFFGVILASLIRTFVHPELFAVAFGPTLAGLGATLIFATILEVCSEGSVPVATDMLLRAKAPGNTFAFLMTGVSTDYTEILSLKETTHSWKIAFFLPLVTFPQVLIIAIILNSLPV
ncbi:MAG: permease [Candidatus Peribacteraceae bacterium]|jgi:hypothetical protein|nr:permease [Candidatus Peribacteraceae bacterium]|tara:strand:- start:1305 stop:2396 length:1092 start_codon:yes stop_codon:yes gene_type:complete